MKSLGCLLLIGMVLLAPGLVFAKEPAPVAPVFRFFELGYDWKTGTIGLNSDKVDVGNGQLNLEGATTIGASPFGIAGRVAFGKLTFGGESLLNTTRNVEGAVIAAARSGKVNAMAKVGYGNADFDGWGYSGMLVGGEARIKLDKLVGVFARATFFPSLQGTGDIEGTSGTGTNFMAGVRLGVSDEGSFMIGYRTEEYKTTDAFNVSNDKFSGVYFAISGGF